jgi:YHS domain-containing protein
MKTRIALPALLIAGTFPFLVTSCGSHNGHPEHVHGGHQELMGTAHDGSEVEVGSMPPEGNPDPGYCPVMGGKVDKEKANVTAALHYDYEGKRYYFCCEGCKPKFEKNPAKWIATPAAPQGGEHSH